MSAPAIVRGVRPILVSVDQIAEYVGLSAGETAAALREGTIPAEEIDGRWYASPDEIDAARDDRRDGGAESGGRA